MEGVRFGVMLGNSLAPLDELFNHVRVIDRLGFDGVWRGDHLVSPDFHNQRLDAFSTLAASAMITDSVTLGSLVTDAFRRHPAILAQTVASLDQISNGRAILGLGAGEPMNLDPFGISSTEKLGRMRESIEVMKALLSSAAPAPEATVSYHGRFYSIDHGFLQVTPLQKPHPPIYVAASSPGTRALAGTLGDGWVTSLSTPKLYREDLKEVLTAAEKAGRKPDALDTALLTHIALTEDASDAIALVDKRLRYEFLAFPKAAGRLSFKVPDEIDWGRITLCNTPNPKECIRRLEQTTEKLMAHVPERAVEETSIAGTAEDCIRKLKDFIEAGVKHFILRFGGTPQMNTEMYYKFRKEVWPHVKPS